MKKANRADVINQFIEVHGNEYDYRFVIYQGTDIKVDIECKKHGVFKQTPYVHRKGSKCPKCASESKALSHSEVLTRFKKVHGDKYDYTSMSTYVNSTTKVAITCPTHGVFLQTSFAHLHGKGCKLCGNASRGFKFSLSQDEWIMRAHAAHNNYYSYESLVYTSAKSKVIVTCPLHGEFSQLANDHLRGRKCPTCSPGGFSPGLPGILYYLRVGTQFGPLYKVGITNYTVELRYLARDRLIITTLYTEEFDNGADAASMEKEILKKYAAFKYVGEPILSSGNTELFTIDILNKDIHATDSKRGAE